MKTIKEILEHNGVYEDCHSYQVIGAIHESMKQYAKQAIESQREIYKDSINDMLWDQVSTQTLTKIDRLLDNVNKPELK